MVPTRRRDGTVAWIVVDETSADTQHEVWAGTADREPASSVHRTSLVNR